MREPEWTGAWRRDIVYRGDNIGIVREVRRRVDGKSFLRVQLARGACSRREPLWVWPEGWRSQLDVGDNPTYVSNCGECGRRFKATRGVETLCRTCDETGLRLRTLRERVGGGERWSTSHRGEPK